ncbi:glycosyltransferase family 2 protein [Desulfomonile tiedjei]|nr:glycosyltransferase [Desulfomonile tiedjei]
MKQPKITVLMSVYNDHGYLARAVESILEQTYDDFEFLIIDDGSTGPLDALDRFRDSRIRIHRHDNIGLTRSLNKGIALASGEFIARMDADDVSLPDRLKQQVAEFDAHPCVDLVGTFFDMVDANDNLIERKTLIVDPLYRLWRLQFHNVYGHGTMMFRKAAAMAAGMYDENLLYAQDFDLWSRISGARNTSIVPEVQYLYRMNSDGDQASVKNYDAQLQTAIRTSTRNLTACNPGLTESDCEELRALYWKFQQEKVSVRGIALIPPTMDGFCRTYGIEGKERNELVKKICRDIQDELLVAYHLNEQEKRQLKLRLDSFCENVVS